MCTYISINFHYKFEFQLKYFGKIVQLFATFDHTANTFHQFVRIAALASPLFMENERNAGNRNIEPL